MPERRIGHAIDHAIGQRLVERTAPPGAADDLADAAAFTRSVPQICKKRRAFAKSSAPVKYSTKTVDHLCDMATSSVCDGRVEALQSILDAIEHGCPAS